MTSSSISKRPNGKWRARYRDRNNVEHARHFARKADGELWLAQQVTRMADGTWVDPLAGRRTFAEYVTMWVDDQVQLRPSTLENTRRRIDTHLLPTFGPRPLAAIRRNEVQAWVRDLTGKGYAPSYVHGLYKQMAQILRAAVADDYLASSPCVNINLPQMVRGRIRIPTLEEVAAIASTLPVDMADVVLAGVGSGLRIGELHGLTVDRVNVLHRTITVDRQLHSRRIAVAFGPPKTKAGERTVPVAQDVVDGISRRLERTGVRAQPVDGVDVQLVFTDANGRPWSRSRWQHAWTYWVTSTDKLGLEVRFHDLRHLYASALIAAGQSAKVIQERLGHASITETFDTYGHLWPSDEEGTRTATEGLLGGIRGLVADRPA